MKPAATLVLARGTGSVALPRSGSRVLRNTYWLLSLTLLFSAAAAENGRALLETDMRAHLNPTRMEMIAQAAQDLAHKLGSRCPDILRHLPVYRGGRQLRCSRRSRRTSRAREKRTPS